MSRSVFLSVVVPVRDERENVLELAEELDEALKNLSGGWECVWVDDASRDGTLERLIDLSHRDPRHRVLRFPEGRGQTAALLAGFRAAGGEFVASLDGDRQNDPGDLPRLLEIACREGLDLVNGVRVERRDTWVRKISSRIANGFRKSMTRDATTDVGCAIRVMRREFASTIPPYRGMHRFLPTFVRLAGGRIGEAPVAHRPRVSGRTKYGVNNRLWVGLADTFAVRWITRRYVSLEASEDGAIPRPAPAVLPALASPAGSMRPVWAALAVLALVLAFSFQGTRGLWEPDEGRYAECAREMLVTGDFITPQLGFQPHFTKPPLTYWSIAVPVALFGRNPWAVRFYLSLAYAGTILLVAALGTRLWNQKTGLLAGLIYATSLLPFGGAGFATPDTLLALWEALALYAFWRSWTAESARDRRLWPALTGAAFGLAFLTKGPPGLLFLPAMALFRYLPAGRRKGAGPLMNLAGLVLFAGLGFTWYLLVILRNPGLLHYFLSDEVVGRMAGKHHRNSQWYGALAIYGPAFLLGSLPWAFFWPRIVRNIRAEGLSRESLNDRPRALFLALVIGLPLAVFCLARSRLVLYVLPLFTPLSLVIARSLLGTTGWAPGSGLSLRSIVRHRWVPAMAAWAFVLVAARFTFAVWPSASDDRRAYQELHPKASAELVFVDTAPRYGLAFYMGSSVKSADWTNPPPPHEDSIEEEVNEVRSGDSHIFLIPAHDEKKLDGLFEKAGVRLPRRVPLGHELALVAP